MTRAEYEKALDEMRKAQVKDAAGATRSATAAYAYGFGFDSTREILLDAIEALSAIAEKRTCIELHPKSTKYKNYQEGWEGVAEFACKALEKIREQLKVKDEK